MEITCAKGDTVTVGTESLFTVVHVGEDSVTLLKIIGLSTAMNLSHSPEKDSKIVDPALS